MAPHDSDSSGDEQDEDDYTETNVLLGYASKEPEDISRLGGRPVSSASPPPIPKPDRPSLGMMPGLGCWCWFWCCHCYCCLDVHFGMFGNLTGQKKTKKRNGSTRTARPRPRSRGARPAGT